METKKRSRKSGKERPAYPNLREIFTRYSQLPVLAGCWYPQTVANTARRWMRHWWAPRSSKPGCYSNINNLTAKSIFTNVHNCRKYSQLCSQLITLLSAAFLLFQGLTFALLHLTFVSHYSGNPGVYFTAPLSSRLAVKTFFSLLPVRS